LKLQNEIEVSAPPDDLFDVLADVERVAPCMPGAEVLEKTGDRSYRVGIKVRLGPVSMQYRGDVEIDDVDDSAHSAKMHARATEARGQGTANATVSMKLDERDSATHAVLHTDMRLSGRAAAMGGGMVKDVSAKMVETFAGNVQEMLAGKPEEAPAAEPAPPPPPSEEEGLPAAQIAVSVADRMRDPRMLAGALAIVWLLGFLMGRRR
jgi:uncharacterized protein